MSSRLGLFSFPSAQSTQTVLLGARDGGGTGGRRGVACNGGGRDIAGPHRRGCDSGGPSDSVGMRRGINGGRNRGPTRSQVLHQRIGNRLHFFRRKVLVPNGHETQRPVCIRGFRATPTSVLSRQYAQGSRRCCTTFGCHRLSNKGLFTLLAPWS